ncbi:hypothetical protein N7491_008024 [Penicillium cf. griseofulvum]|uniref:Uncharacterized protein n=1 Tax=Penicillium cf. griseofulvum TaxID=2972120 RepID=A0A9W9J3Y7_9EURO|nr:hypothetical protein N7472_008949 [Penicillium cf. griseofulvum]KAJ5427582.1 hypothetical protein N7491_008024 [Penicillium cf. griseofulvum]KAJ5431779.1 hypothetical protein N7445_008277 [Penicillium cf. griseofulvum]
MANQRQLALPKWFEKLEGKSNWSSWRKGLHEAIMTVDPVSWDVIMDRLGDEIKQESTTTTEEEEGVDPILLEHDDSSGTDSLQDPEFTVTHTNQLNPNFNFPTLKKSRPGDRRKLNIRARDLLASGLGKQPLFEIERVMDAHEAYVKLESVYGKTSAQSVHIAWEKFSKVRYSTRGLTPAAFVDRFQKSLRDVKDQCVEVPPTVELAQFQQAIKPNPNSTTFMADMKVDIYDPKFMDLVYEDFLKDQSPI